MDTLQKSVVRQKDKSFIQQQKLSQCKTERVIREVQGKAKSIRFEKEENKLFAQNETSYFDRII